MNIYRQYRDYQSWGALDRALREIDGVWSNLGCSARDVRIERDTSRQEDYGWLFYGAVVLSVDGCDVAHVRFLIEARSPKEVTVSVVRYDGPGSKPKLTEVTDDEYVAVVIAEEFRKRIEWLSEQQGERAAKATATA